MLELHAADGAFRQVEAYLREAGFFGGGARGVAADLYLGYGLSRGMRRTPAPDPPEPCPLPLAACRVRPAGEPARPAGLFTAGPFTPTWTEADYERAVDAVHEAI